MSRYQKRPIINRPAQGDIYKNVQAPFSATPINVEGDKEFEITEFKYPYAIILSQECDLEQNYFNRQGTQEGIQKKQDKFIPSILFAPAYLAQSLREGKHLKDVELTMESINSERWKIIKQNLNQRYHFLSKDLNLGVPNLAIDFKHYFTISRDFFFHSFFNNQHYVVSLDLLFREDLSNRFSHYLSRIGLPKIEKPIKVPLK